MNSDNVYQLDKRLERLPIHNGGQPPYDGGMEARVAKLEVAVEYIQRDISEIKSDVRTLRDKVDSHFLITGAMIIATALGLAGMMAKGFGWL